MKKIIIVVLSICLLGIGGCRKDERALKTWPPNPAYSTFAIEPFDTKRTLLPEAIYHTLPDNFVLALADNVQAELQGKNIFSKVVQSSECPANGLKLQGQLYALEHHMRSYNMYVRGEIVDCNANKNFCRFDLRKDDSEIVVVVKDMTEMLMDKIKDCLN